MAENEEPGFVEKRVAHIFAEPTRKIEEGIEKVKADWWAGFFMGMVVILAAQSVWGKE